MQKSTLFINVWNITRGVWTFLSVLCKSFVYPGCGHLTTTYFLIFCSCDYSFISCMLYIVTKLLTWAANWRSSLLLIIEWTHCIHVLLRIRMVVCTTTGIWRILLILIFTFKATQKLSFCTKARIPPVYQIKLNLKAFLMFLSCKLWQHHRVLLNKTLLACSD